MVVTRVLASHVRVRSGDFRLAMREGCPRCGKRHRKRLTFRKMENGIGEYTHWATCPTKQQPVLGAAAGDGHHKFT
jgi:hypothetical protein